jgi:phospholipase C
MATQRSAKVQITNNTGGNAQVILFHNNSSNGTQRGTWEAASGQTVGPMTVYFETGIGTQTIQDYWSVLVHVKDGPNAGFYVNSGTVLDPYWKECQLQHADADKTLTFTVSAQQFKVTLDSGGCAPESMVKLTPRTPITHVFVVMLENHSFDNAFAFSGIQGITAATTANSNTYNGTTYHVQSSAPLRMPTDPDHNFDDVLVQLAGHGATYKSGGPYPPINNSGFAENYATSTTEGPPPSPDDIGRIMACFATPSQLPVLFQLATQFAVCDHWHSSLPGPTWPNRFFLHGASASGLDDSPTTAQMAQWEVPGQGFKYPNGSIYQALSRAGIPYRLYNDTNGPPLYQSLYSDTPDAGSPVGAVPQVSALAGISLFDVNSLSHFASDLQGPYPYPYTFIEPNYGDVTSGSYAGGSSQHPKDNVYGGEHLLSAVYSAIRSSPYWNSSLLIITYDEHGGFYDSVEPPAATPPGDGGTAYSMHGYTFDRYGVRVPAVIVSPLIAAGTVDHTVYDHSSVLKTVEQLWGLSPLTHRDASANGLVHLLSQQRIPRSDTPEATVRPLPLVRAAVPTLTAEQRAQIDQQPVPPSSNLMGALGILKKAEGEMSMGTKAEVSAIQGRFQQATRSRGDARAYVSTVMEKVGLALQQRKAGRRGRP